jgi:hypothetical protein
MYRKVITISLLLALAATPLNAFDTGHHADLTRAALSRRGFSEDAIKTVQLANWLTDYYQVPIEKLDLPGLRVLNPHPRDLVHKVEDLHFDNLFSAAEIQHYWGKLAENTKRLVTVAVQQYNTPGRTAAQKKEITQELLMILGISLHTVQDFYAHSNWVEKHLQQQPPQYETATWWTEQAAHGPVAARVPVPDYHTGWYKGWRNFPEPQRDDLKHGTYTDRGASPWMNHDSYCRPSWDEAYVFAYAATVEWVNAVIDWARQATRHGGQNPFTNIGAYALDTQTFLGAPAPLSRSERDVLDWDCTAAKRISEWIKSGEHNGHWKGPNSGWTENLLYEGRVWITTLNSVYVKKFKGDQTPTIGASIVTQMARDLYDLGRPPVPQVVPPVVQQHNPSGQIAVSVRTTTISKPANKYVFARIRVGADGLPENQLDSYDEAVITLDNTTQLSPATWTGWWTIHFVDNNVTSVRVVYALFEQYTLNSLSSVEGRLTLTRRQAPSDVGRLTYNFVDVLNNGNPALLLDVPRNAPTRMNYPSPANPVPVRLDGGAQSVEFTVVHARLR